MQKTKALNCLFPENVRRVEKQAYSYFLGYMLRKYQGGNLRSDSTLPIRDLPHDLVTGGIPHAGSRHTTEDEMVGRRHQLNGHEFE